MKMKPATFISLSQHIKKRSKLQDEWYTQSLNMYA